MAELSLLVPGPAPATQRHVTITTIDGRLTYTVPLLSHVGIDSHGSRWAVLDRPGRFPLTVHGGFQAAQGSITVKVGEDLSRSVENDFTFLRAFGTAEQPVVVACGLFYRWTASGAWIVTGIHVDEFQLLPGSNEIAQATVTIDLTAAMTPGQAMSTGR